MGSRKRNRNKKDREEMENDAGQEQQDEQTETEPGELSGTGNALIVQPPAARDEPGSSSQKAGPDDGTNGAKEAEGLAQYSADRREKLEEYYHNLLAERETTIDEKQAKIEELEKKAGKSLEQYKALKKAKEDAEATVKDMEKKVKDVEYTAKRDNERLEWQKTLVSNGELELKNMMKKKAEFFQERKKAYEELAESRATNQGLHQRIDELEKDNAEKDRQITDDAKVKEKLNNIHCAIEETFTDVKCDELSTPELAEKLRERENRLKHAESSSSLKEDKKKSRKSLADDLPSDSEDGSEAEDDGDKTLTEGFENPEMKQENERLKGELESAKTQEGVYLSKISEQNKELAAANKKLEEHGLAKWQLGFSDVISVDTSPISPTPSTPSWAVSTPTLPEPPQQQLGFSNIITVDTSPISPTFPAVPPTQVITEIRQPTARDCWEQMPRLLFWLLASFVVALACVSYITMQERELWLGANDGVRFDTVRLSMRRKDAYCNNFAQFEGVLAPFWLAVGRWLDVPIPSLLS